MEKDAMERMQAARAKWAAMTAEERHEASHEAIDIAVIVLEEAHRGGKITEAGRDDAITLLGIACAYQAELAE